MPVMMILKVAVAAPVYSIFDYLPPAGCDSRSLIPGVRLVVPFGRCGRCGVLVGVTTESHIQTGRLKRVREVLDDKVLFTADDLSLLSWAADYYRHPLGEVIANALPVRLRKGLKARECGLPGWRLTALGEAEDPAGQKLTRAPRQAELMRWVSQSSAGMTQEDIYRRCGSCAPILRKLEQRGWLERTEIQVLGGVGISPPAEAGPGLNKDQRLAVDQVSACMSGFGAFLLDGVTGSGKTEVYLELVKKVLARGGQTLVLVPEIGLTPQLFQRFQRRLQTTITVLHSGLGERERELAWQQARQGRARVVIGTRSSVFVPMPDLSLILVDEEHDLSFKQQDGFRYSARDIAVVRAQRCDCPVVLGSATPSLESTKNVIEGRYYQLRLPERAGGGDPPKSKLVGYPLGNACRRSLPCIEAHDRN